MSRINSKRGRINDDLLEEYLQEMYEKGWVEKYLTDKDIENFLKPSHKIAYVDINNKFRSGGFITSINYENQYLLYVAGRVWSLQFENIDRLFILTKDLIGK